MSSRLPETQIPFGLVAWLEETRISLPLKGVECRFNVTAGVASVEIDQIFHQSHRAPLDCTYTFPLPAEAAVFRCEMRVNDRVIAAKVEERGEAKRIFQEQKAAGHRAALVETERENLFTLSLGNIQPGDVIVIRLAYFQTLERAGESLSLRIPVCPGVRYIPGEPLLRSPLGRGIADDTDQVPDASRISPPRIDALHPDAAYFFAEGRIVRSDVAEGSLSSPTHPILVHADENALNIALAAHGAVPDRDLVFRWKEARDVALQPRGWVYTKGGDRYALVQLRAPAEVAVAADLPHDYYFLIDRSGSMQGAKWTKTCEALTAFVKLLGARDRVWITLFESGFKDFAEAPMLAPGILRDKNFRDLVKIGTAGGTELRPAAKHVLEKIRAHSPEGAATVVLITDGQMGNEKDLLKLFRRESGMAVHTFGIDTAVNDAFLKALARQQNGKCWLQTPDDDIAGTVAGLADRLRRPVITGLEIHGAWQPAASRLPALHAGETLEISLRMPSEENSAVEIAGLLGSGNPHVFSLNLIPSDNAALPLLWARERIATLLADDHSADAIALAKAHNILCEGAAFIAWDEAEKVEVARREIYQPSQTPHCAIPSGATIKFMRSQPLSGIPSCEGISLPPAGARLACPSPQAFSPTPARNKKQPEPIASRLMAAGVESKFASVLELWADAKWLKKAARHRALKKLLRHLKSSGATKETRIRICREFIDEHLASEPAIYPELLKLLTSWEAAAHA
jgi:Ca-activated chloride channel family protein